MVSTAPLPRNRRYIVEWILLFVTLLVLGGYIVYSADTQYIWIEDQERQRLVSETGVIEKNLVTQIFSINRAIDGILEDMPSLQRIPDSNRLTVRRMQIICDTLVGIRNISVLNAKGQVIFSSREEIIGRDLSARDYYKNALKNPNPKTLYVTPPFTTIFNEYVIGFVRKVTGPDGGFDGIVIATIKPEYFMVLLDSVRYTPDSRSYLAHGDGKLFMTSPERNDLNGKDLATPNSLFTRHRNSGQSTSVFSGVTSLTGDERMISFRTIQPAGLYMDKPLVVTASRALPSIFASWYRETKAVAAMFGLLALVAILSLYFYQRRQRYRDRIADSQEQKRKVLEQSLQDSEARLRSIFDASPDALLISDTDGMISMANEEVQRLLGYTVDELIGTSIEMLVPEHLRANHPALHALFEVIPTSRTMGHGLEIMARRKNGSECQVEISLSQIRTDQGVYIAYALRNIAERKQSEAKIHELAFFDTLTGLPNKTLLLDRLQQAMTASSRNDSYGALLLINLDNFKMVNDTLGHHIGDLLLKQVAQRLTACVRAGDTVARLSGDEFWVMLASLSVSESDAAVQSEAIGEKILSTLNRPYQLSDSDFRSSASIGVTLFNGHRTIADEVLKKADLAMYKSKATGRNALRFFDPAMEVAVMERAALERDLHYALQEKQFLLHYQPQIVGESRMIGAEVLVRWQHPQRGMVSPVKFIHIAEECGLILPLGQWVLETACSQLASWATRPEMAHLTVAVNVSAHQFHQNNFVDQVLAVLNNTGANPQRLKLELTESLLVSNVDEVVEKMFALKAKGVGFSLDDFGTGSSSLSYLKRLPIDQLKIDQSFVRDILIDPNDAAIAKTIIALAQSLGLGVIAEGVETATQRDFLASSGCHAYQGYFFSRPLPIDDFEEFAQRV